MKKGRQLRFSVFVGVLLVGFTAARATVEYGFAVDYLKDVGIKNDSRVVFSADFEDASISALASKWEYKTNTARMSQVSDIPATSGGTKSLFMNGSADLYQRLLSGYDSLYVRYYTKMNTACVQIHHWPWLGGHNPSTSYPWPRAGEKPVGDERFSTSVEPMIQNWRWDFYTYYMAMHMCGDGMYWGNDFTQGMSIPANRGEWICIEFMVKLNDPGTPNGEQAFWINGEKKQHLKQGSPTGKWEGEHFTSLCRTCEPFPGMEWRTSANLKINYFWLEHYVDSDPGCSAWFDDLVIATKYIGPMVDTSPQIEKPRQTECPALPFQIRGSRQQCPAMEFELGLPGRYDLCIYSSHGKKVFACSEASSEAGRQTVQLPEPLKNGIYAAALSRGGRRVAQKFIVIIYTK